MPEIQAPQAAATRILLEKAATSAGFPNRIAEDPAGWSAHLSWIMKGTLHLAAAGPHGPCWLALDRPAVAAAWPVPVAALAGPGSHRYAFPDFAALTAALASLWPLLQAIPDDPLTAFAAQTANLPRSTEAERLVIQRIGQDIFRARLLSNFGGRCPLTGITDPALLRASHIIPWADCETDADRLDPDNGLLLSALWDAAFDAHLVSFDDRGAPIYAPYLSAETRSALLTDRRVPLTPGRRARLTTHRDLVPIPLV